MGITEVFLGMVFHIHAVADNAQTLSHFTSLVLQIKYTTVVI